MDKSTVDEFYWKGGKYIYTHAVSYDPDDRFWYPERYTKYEARIAYKTDQAIKKYAPWAPKFWKWPTWYQEAWLYPMSYGWLTKHFLGAYWRPGQPLQSIRKQLLRTNRKNFYQIFKHSQPSWAVNAYFNLEAKYK